MLQLKPLLTIRLGGGLWKVNSRQLMLNISSRLKIYLDEISSSSTSSETCKGADASGSSSPTNSERQGQENKLYSS